MSKIKLNNGLTRKSLSAAVMAVCAGVSWGASAQEVADEELVVTGFRSSLKAAIDEKRNSTGQVDAIIAEDIADFPDLNLAESLQRIPGIAITRSNGEGSRITVRGLSGQYTRVQINGMESRAGVGSNTGRDFDYNMFASELFNRITVHKTSSASVDEGSLGATVMMETARAFDYDEGNTFLIAGNLQYNDLIGDTDPRLTALYAYNDPDGVFGFSASVAYSEVTTRVSTANTVRWQRSRFRTVNGEDCSGVSAACDEVANAFHARIPRYGENDHNRERLGVTLGAQFAPSEATTISVDGMFASFNQTQDFRTLEVLFRSNEGDMDVVDYSIQSFPDRFDADGEPVGNSTIESMTVNNAFVRSERYHMEEDSDFQQITVDLKHEFSDTLTLNALIGQATSDGGRPVETTLMYDDRDYNGFRYDYSRSTSEPVLAYNGADVTDGTIYELTELRDGTRDTQTDNQTIEADLVWAQSDAFVLSGGISVKSFELDAVRTSRNSSTCALGFVTARDCDDPDVYGIRGTAALSESFTYGGASGAGSTTTWVVPDLDGWMDAIPFYDTPLNVREGNTFKVEEVNTGAWLQAAGDIEVGSGVRFQYEVGVRHVETEQTSAGFNSGVWVEIERPTYDFTLPSVNLSLWATEDLVFRAGFAETIARPALSNLSPGGSVDPFDQPGQIRFQNPLLDPTESTNFDLAAEWYFADGALLSFAYFQKEIASFPVRDEVENQTFASTGLPLSVIEPTSPFGENNNGSEGGAEGSRPDFCQPGCWTVSQLVNGDGADVSGWELGLQAPFDAFSDNLPGILANMGFIANYTSVDSEVERTFNGNTVKDKLNGLSNTQYNATIYYEGDRFSTRLSVANRSEYFTNNNASRNGNLYEIVEPSTYWDYSASYEATENLTVSFEIVNLLDTPYERSVDETARRVYQYDLTGRNFLLGARYKF
jgi:iron complex outermembrane receptor protein